jgi:hypothetical protein
MKKKVTKKLSDERRAWIYFNRNGTAYVCRWPVSSTVDAYLAGLRAGRRERRK